MRHAWLSAVLLVLSASVCWAQDAKESKAGQDGLAGVIPSKAVFYVERRGHDNVRAAFLESNLGQMYKDEAMTDFVQDSRVAIGKMVLKNLFDLSDEKDVTKYHADLHNLLKPFWYRPAAMFLLAPSTDTKHFMPDVGFLCEMNDKYKAGAKSGLESLMAFGVPAKGQAGNRQAFTYKSGKLTWSGVAKTTSGEEFTLSSDAKTLKEELADKFLFMACWTDKYLLIVPTLQAADALEASLAKPGLNKNTNKSYQAVMAKTALKDWAFRWFMDVAAAREAMPKERSPREMGIIAKGLGVDTVRGIGGTGGYADKVFTRPTFIDAPGTKDGLLKLFKKKGSFKGGLDLAPGESTFILAGEVDMDQAAKLAKQIALMGQAISNRQTDSQPVLNEEQQKLIDQITAVLKTGDGRVAVFVGELQTAMMGVAPIGMVMGIKDQAAAQKAIDELIKSTDSENVVPDDTTHPAEYRKVKIRYLGSRLTLAVLKDRVIMGLSIAQLKAAIDAALDKAGGLDPKGEAAKYAALGGDGAGIFVLDLKALVKLGWPLLLQGAASVGEEFPLASLPSSDKMAKLVGPEIVIFETHDDGLLIKGRGKIPLITKLMGSYPVMGAGMMYFMYSSMRHVEPAAPAPPAPNDSDF